MKKISCFMLTLMLVLSFGVAIAQEKQNALGQLTGDVWMQSSSEHKNALIYGVECVVSIEYITAKHTAEASAKTTSHKSIVRSLNAFPESWILAFSGVPREDIVAAIDTWFTENPEKLDRPVFDVLWYEIMEPKFKTR